MAIASALPLHQKLDRRNRRVRFLRIGVPVFGMLVLAALMLQIFFSSLGTRFSIGQISVTPEAVVVEAPEYVGVLEDGASYRVSAVTARAATNRTDIIGLADARLVLDRADGVQMIADAAAGQLDMTNETTTVPGVADISDSNGTTGILRDSVFDWRRQVLTVNGEVIVDYADGTSVRADRMVYDAQAGTYSFERSVVTLPYTPGEAAAETSGGESQQ
jgi:lipopolysaccharide export system protein LptC